MDSRILHFLERYKQLDELCKQALRCNEGVSAYLLQMENSINTYKVKNWKKDYNRLRGLSWKHYQILNELGSYSLWKVKIADFIWIRRFCKRIVNCTDPLAVLEGIRPEDRGMDSL